MATQLASFLFQLCSSAVASECLISPPLAVRKKQPGQWDDPTYPCRIRPVRVFQTAPTRLSNLSGEVRCDLLAEAMRDLRRCLQRLRSVGWCCLRDPHDLTPLSLGVLPDCFCSRLEEPPLPFSAVGSPLRPATPAPGSCCDRLSVAGFLSGVVLLKISIRRPTDTCLPIIDRKLVRGEVYPPLSGETFFRFLSRVSSRIRRRKGQPPLTRRERREERQANSKPRLTPANPTRHS